MSSSRPQSAGRSSLQERLDSLDTSRSSPFLSERPKIQNEINLDPLLEKGNRCIQEGKITEGLDSYTSTIQYLFRTFGPQSGEFLSHFTKCIENLNHMALKLIQQSKAEQSMKVLTYCRDYTNLTKYGNFPFLKVLTLNNLAVLYRRINKGQLAFASLQKALSILSENNLMIYSSKTYLNLCAISSTAGDHASAANYAKNAVIHSQDELLEHKKSQISNPVILKEKVSTLSVAYHNMGVEYEHLSNLEEAIKWYEKSVNVLHEYHIINEELTYRFRNALVAARERLDSQIFEKTIQKKKTKKVIKLKRSETPRQIATERLTINIPKRSTTPNSARILRATPTSSRNVSPLAERAQNFIPASPHTKVNNFVEPSKHINMKAMKIHIPKQRIAKAKNLRITDSLMSDQVEDESVEQNSKIIHHSRSGSLGSHRIINPEQEKEELKVLEKMGIIQWTEEDHANEEPSNEKTNRTPLSARTDNKTPRDTLKSNRLNFLNSLQECDNLENLSGNVIILSEQRTEDDDKTPSSQSRIRLEDLLSNKPPKKPLERRNSIEPVKTYKDPRFRDSFFNSPNSKKNMTVKKFKKPYVNPQFQRVGSNQFPPEEIPRIEIIPPAPIIHLNPEQIRHTLTSIKALYHLKQKREMAILALQYRKRLGNKILLTKKKIILSPQFQTDTNELTSTKEDIYTLISYIIPQTHEVTITLFSRLYNTRHEISLSLHEIDLYRVYNMDETFTVNYKDSANFQRIKKFIYSLMPKLQIIDHLIVIKEEEKEEEDLPLSDIEPPPKWINFKLHEKEISKLQALVKGKFAREKYKLLKNRRCEVLFKKTYTLEVGDPKVPYVLIYKIIRDHQKNKSFAKCFNYTKQKYLPTLMFPPLYVSIIKDNYKLAFRKTYINPEKMIMEFTDDVFYFLFPEQKQTGLYKYDIKKVIKIQRFVRKRQSMQLYRMKLAKKRKYGSLIFLKKWTITYEVYVFVMNAFYNKEEETFIFSTTNNPGIDVKPFTIPIKEVDKFEAGDNICNLRRVLDSISATIQIKKEREIKIIFDIRKFMKDLTRFKTRLESEVRDTNFQDGSMSGEEVRAKIKALLNDTIISEPNLFIPKKKFGIPNDIQRLPLDDEIKMTVDNIELSKIQRIKRYFKAKLFKEKMRIRRIRRLNPQYLLSKANLIFRTNFGLSYSPKSHAYKRFHASDSELANDGPVGSVFLKSYPNVEIKGTNLRAKVNIYYDKRDKNKKSVICELVFPVKNSIQWMKIYTYEIASDFKKKNFVKRIEEMLLEHLEWSKLEKAVVFARNKSKIAGFAHIDFEIRAKAMIKRYITKHVTKKKSKNQQNAEILYESVIKLQGCYFFVKFFLEFTKKQILAFYSLIGEKNLEKKAIIKLDNFLESPVIDNLFKSDWIIGADDVREAFCPYILFFIDNINVDVIGKREDYRLIGNREVFDIEMESNHFIQMLLAVLPSANFINKYEKKKQTSPKKQRNIKRQEYQNTSMALATEEAVKSDHLRTLNDYDYNILNEGEPKSPIIRFVPLEEQIAASRVIQRWNKRRMLRHFLMLVMTNAKRRSEMAMMKGNLIKKTFTKIEKEYYCIDVYKRNNSHKYEFYARRVTESRTQKKKYAVIHGIYISERNKLINTKGKPLVDFLIDHMDINGPNISFHINLDEYENYVDVPTTELKTSRKVSEQIESPIPSIILSKSNQSEERESILDEKSLNKSREVTPIKLQVPKLYRYDQNNRPHTLQTKIELFSEVIDDDPNAKKEPVLKATEALKSNLLLYQVYYNEEKAIAPTEQQSRLFGEQNNVIKIDVDVSELKKMTYISPKNQNDLRILAKEITKSIKLDANGTVLVNSKKMPVEAVSVVEKNVDIQTKSSQRQKNVVKKLLNKTIKFFFDLKYLIFVFYVEKSSNITGLNQDHALDDVFQEYEVYIIIEAVCLSNPSEEMLSWEMSFTEAERITQKEKLEDIAKYFSTNVAVAHKKLLCAITKNIDYKTHECYLINLSAILSVQRKFREAKSRKNYLAYTEFLKYNKENILAKKAYADIFGGYFIFIAYIKDDYYIGASAWNIDNFARSELFFDKELLGNKFKDKKEQIGKLILSCLSIERSQMKSSLILDEKFLVSKIGRLK